LDAVDARRGVRIGIDIGGTFTDFVLLDDRTGELRLHKRLTTPADPAVGALEGLTELLRQSGLSLGECETVIHGTTLVTNAVIERRGVPTALLTTRGFRDVLEMGREQRYDIYDLFLTYPEPLVPRRWRAEVEERMSRDGDPLRPLDTDRLQQTVRRLADQGAEAVAISFLHAYRNPAHERAAAALVRAEFPRLAVSVSSEVAPEIGEFERTSTTVCNAYVQPLVDRYIHRLESELRRRHFPGPFYLMQSSGGLASPAFVRQFPVRLLESGPAGGVLVGAFLSRTIPLSDLVAFDMGGTTAKICLISHGRPDPCDEVEVARVHRFKRGSGLPIGVPALDLMEIGAGGGSVAWTDRLGLLRVGPRSAGAEPGPACYGHGGTDPTVTDACLGLGYLNAEYFLGGAMPLYPERAAEALGDLAARLHLTPVEAAWGVYRVVCENMATAARVHILEKGRDPRRFPLLAFGGAGPLHAAEVARALGAPEVIIPPVSGVAAALGFLVAPITFEFTRSSPAELRAVEWDEVRGLYDEIEAQARATLASAGVDTRQITMTRSAKMRLSGQFHDIEVSVPDGHVSSALGPHLAQAFESEYRRLYHAVLPGYEPLVLSWRLRASGPAPDIRLPAPAAGGLPRQRGVPRRSGGHTRQAFFPPAGFVEAPVYDREALQAGQTLAGPAIIEERESTTVIGPRDALKVDGAGNLRITVGARL
jgi:5-oxoprolinase (ATP-hydrolysing)